jgi:hypothetical protein
MTINQQLNTLFEDWEQSKDEHRGVFIKDGVINENEWEKTTPKIIFIAKEANQQGNVKAGDFREEWRLPGRKYPFADRLTEWTYGMLNDFPIFSNISEANDEYEIYRQKMAFMNVKKMGGSGVANASILGEHFNNNLKFLRKQIAIINPHIIVLCLSFENFYRKSLFAEAEWKNCGYNIDVAKWNNIKLIDFYHPSARNGAAASYSLLQNVVRSEVFKSL